jgi:hypothetical protein
LTRLDVMCGAAQDDEWRARRVPRRVRRSGDHRGCAVARCRQRHDHDRQGHLAIGIVWAGRLWPAQRFALGAGPNAASGLAVSVRLAARPGRDRGAGIVRRALLCRVRLAVPAASARSRRRPPLAGPRLTLKSPDTAIVQVGPSPATAGKLAEAKLAASDRPSSRKWRVLSAFYSV